MCPISYINNIQQTYPLPPLRNLKRHFILCNFRQGLFFFDFAFLNQPLLFCLNLPVQLLAGTFFGALLHQLALNRHLENGFLHIHRKTAAKILQPVPRLFVAVEVRKQPFDFGDDALLLGKGREGESID